MDKNKKPKYKLCERNLKVLDDLDFVRNVLKDLDVESEPATRGVLLDLAYSSYLKPYTYTSLYNFFQLWPGINWLRPIAIPSWPIAPT